MSAAIELEHVVKVGPKGRPAGRVHLTALVPDAGEVHTLCGQRFATDVALAVQEAVTCQLCLRRSHSASLVSAALFEAGLGSKLLELSVVKAGDRPQTPPSPEDRRPVRPTVVKGEPQKPQEEAPERPGELRVRGLKELAPDLFRSPAGVLIRLRRIGEAWHVADLDYEGSVVVRRRSAERFELLVGDVDIVIDADGAVRAAYSVR